MKTLYLHIGLPKTGTSFLQAVFAYNAARYAEHGLSYPDLHGNHDGASKGKVSSGNAVRIAGFALPSLRIGLTPLGPAELLDSLNEKMDHLLSSEWLCGCPFSYLRELEHTLSRKFRVQFLAFVRSPQERIASAYLQGLKSGMYRNSLEHNLENFISGERTKLRLLLDLGASVRILNYDVHKNDMIRCMDEVLFGRRVSETPPFHRVNVSPDVHQVATLQIASMLELADIALAQDYLEGDSGAEKRPSFVIPPAVSDAILEALGPEIQAINERLPNEDALRQPKREVVAAELVPTLDSRDIAFLSQLIEVRIKQQRREYNGSLVRWTKEAEALKGSDLPEDFDVLSYMNLHQDVVDAGVDPVKHYIIFGMAEGRRYK